MKEFVSKNSIVREIWKNFDVVLLIFAGSAAEFALNKAVDWLYYTGKLPKNPLERLFSTIEYAQKIVFSENEIALVTIDSITKIHQGVEKNRGQVIPDWAYRDVLYMLIDYSIRSFELMERKLEYIEKEEVFNVFIKLGNRMQLANLPLNYQDWLIDRNVHLTNDLNHGAFTTDLFLQYKKHLGSFRYYLLIEIQKNLVPPIVFNKIYKTKKFPTLLFLKIYKSSKKLNIDKLIKTLILPKKYKHNLLTIETYKKYN